jgi:hypothetical protein
MTIPDPPAILRAPPTVDALRIEKHRQTPSSRGSDTLDQTSANVAQRHPTTQLLVPSGLRHDSDFTNSQQKCLTGRSFGQEKLAPDSRQWSKATPSVIGKHRAGVIFCRGALHTRRGSLGGLIFRAGIRAYNLPSLQLDAGKWARSHPQLRGLAIEILGPQL